MSDKAVTKAEIASEIDATKIKPKCSCIVTKHGRITPHTKLLKCPTHGYMKRGRDV